MSGKTPSLFTGTITWWSWPAVTPLAVSQMRAGENVTTGVVTTRLSASRDTDLGGGRGEWERTGVQRTETGRPVGAY